MAQKSINFILLSNLMAVSFAQSSSSPSSSSPARPNPIVSVFLPSADPQPLVASVVTANPTVTIYNIICPKTGSTECGIPVAMNLTVSSNSIYEYSLISPERSAHVQCTIKSDATCKETAKESSGSTATVQSDTIPANSVSYIPITVTAGLDKLASATNAAQPSSSTNVSGNGPKQTGAAGNSTSKPSSAGKGTICWTPLALISLGTILANL